MQEQLSASERLKALTDQLEQGVSDIFQSGQYAAYLTAMSKFHHYSFGNAMLIFMQCPNASHVAGYVAGWSRGKDLSQLKTSLERIRDTAAELIDSIDPPKELSQPVQEKPAQKRRNARGKRNQPDRLSR